MKKSTKYIYFCDLETTSGDSEYTKRPCCDWKLCTKCAGSGWERYRTKVLYWYMVRKTDDIPYIKCESEWKEWKNSVKEFYEGYDLASFFKTLRGLNHNSLLYFHNLGYDGSYILWYLQNDYVLKGKNIIPWIDTQTYNDNKKKWDKNTHFRTLHNSSTIYQIIVNMKSKSRYHKHIFQCSNKLLSASVDGLGQITKDFKSDKYLGVKDKIDYFYKLSDIKDLSPDDLALYKEYCKNDVFIVMYNYVNLCNNFDDAINSNNHFTFKGEREINLNAFLTIGSVNFRITKNYLANKWKKFKIKSWCYLKDYKLGKKFYKGGYTNFATWIDDGVVECDNGVGLDINSSYPYQMTQKLPYGPVYDDEYVPCKYPNDVYWFYVIKYDYVSLKKGMTLPTLFDWNDDDREISTYITSRGSGEAYLTKLEFDELLHWYDFENLRIVKKYYAKQIDYLKEIYETLYNMRLEYKKQNNQGGSLACKILMNAGYGKFAQNPFRAQVVICENKDRREEFMSREMISIGKHKYTPQKTLNNKYGWTHGNDELMVLKHSEIVDEENEYVKTNNIWAAVAIASGARVSLFRGMRAVGVENVIYCDTDSLYLRNRPDNLEKKILIDNKQLGAWKVEKENIYLMKVLGKKKYKVESKLGVEMKYCGVKINETHVKHLLTEDFFRKNINNGNLKAMNVQGGKLLVWKNVVLKTVRKH